LNPGIHAHTPRLTVIEPRNLAVCSIGYYRSAITELVEARINHTTYDPVGRMIAQRDPRLFLDASAPANLSTVYSLSGNVLCAISADSGTRLSLFGEAGQPVHSWDGRGSQRWMHYDPQLRLTELFEHAAQGVAIRAECLSYAASEAAFADHNQCGRLICHEDLPGSLLFNEYAFTGAVLEQQRRFADEPSPGFTTRSRFNALGDLLSRTDAQGNHQRFSQTLDGQLRAVDLRLSDTPDWLPMVSAIRYTPHGQVQQEVAGNGVTTSLEYTEEDGRLKRLVSRLGQNDPLQDLRYAYDPVGNVSGIEDAALPVRYFANQRVAPVSHYWYDTLYRLIEATGWEAGSVNYGPASLMTTDPEMPGNYRQTYRYDAGNNLLELTHVGPQNHGHRLVAATHSNRCLPVREGIEPTEEDFRNNFDANGNLLRLQPGQTLDWDVRNQLKEVRPVQRDSGPDDFERYEYGADGMRVRKVRALQTNAQTNIIETLYLPALEIRTHSGTGEVLHVIDVATGRGSVRVLHWVACKPEGIANNQQRFSLTDHLGSSTLELDQHAKIISQERYYPFGGTAWSSGEAVQVSYKTVRYSGKEQDATGFYYYGLRYYLAGWQRWLNPDPAGMQDGPNVFAFVKGNPVSFKDVQGLGRIDIGDLSDSQANILGIEGEWSRPSRNPARYPDPRKEASKLVEVSDEIFISLGDAHLSNLITKAIIYKGAENQRLDLWRVGEDLNSILGVVRSGPVVSIPEIQKNAVGNCGEHASVNFHLLASTETKGPVFRVGTTYDVDHSFVVIGDPRGTPRSELVIADAWPFFPLAHTANHGRFGIGPIYEYAGANADPKYAIDSVSLEQNGAMSFPVLNKSNNEDRQFFEWIQKKPGTYVEVYSRENRYLGVDYVNSKGHQRGSHLLPDTYLGERMAHYRSYLA
jgi:RHS repeat-associated protein